MPSSFVRDQAGDTDRLMELTGLGQRVLPDRGVQHEEHFVRRTRTFLRDDSGDLAEFVHEIRFRVQPAGRIDQDHIHLPSFRGGNPIEATAAGSAPWR